MKTYEQEIDEVRQWARYLVASICESDANTEEILYHLIMKRQYDGLNGRAFDSTVHLYHEIYARSLLSGFIENQNP